MKSLGTEAAGLFESVGWPTPEDESWRRTDLSRLLPAGALDAAAGIGSRITEKDAEHPRPLLPDGYAARVITEGGIPVAVAVSGRATDAGLAVEWSGGDDLPDAAAEAGHTELREAADRITAWHWRDLPGSLVIHLPRRAVLNGPVVVEERLVASAGGCDEPILAVSVPHLHIEAAEAAEVDVVWSFEGAPCNPGTPVVNAGLTVDAGACSKVGVTVRQNLGKRTAVFLHGRIGSARDSRVDVTESHMGGALVKTRIRSVLDGEGADVRMNGIFVSGEGRHLDIGTIQEHRSPHASSDALYKGAVLPGGRSIFTGLIEVAPDAAKTDAYLTNRNLVLGEGARADSVPQLNILTDDVKCSHGSTTGRPDPEQLFYLQARGISPVEALREITRGFLAEVTGRAPEPLAELLAADLDFALAGA